MKNIESKLKKNKTIVVGFFVWLIAIISIASIPPIKKYFNNQRVKKILEQKDKYDARYEALPDDLKTQIEHYEKALIELGDNQFHILADDYFDQESASVEKMLIRIPLDYEEIEYDPVAVKRSYEVSKILRKLNNAQRKILFNNCGAVILNKQGRYFFIADESLYTKYVEEFGEECPECPIK
ncbi:MAG: hypothetical protein MUP98_02200 [Candidatus Aminicenantes bacterium]|nr:hypothetical protein [Candidatus Aminicenantes bacterium]